MISRLVYAVPADLGSGAAHCVHVVKMGAALRRQGLDVNVCVRAAPDESDLARSFGLPDAFPVTRVPMQGLGPSSFRFARGVLSIAPRNGHVLTRNLPTAAIVALSGRMTLLELHSPVETQRERWMFRLFLRASGCRGLITITEALKLRFLEEFGADLSHRIHVLPDAADPIMIPDHKVSKSGTVGYVGSFLPGKGVETVLKLAAAMPDIQFVLIGGPESNLPSGVHPTNLRFLGVLPHAEAMRAMAGFDVALLPNQNRVLVSGGIADIGKWTSPLKLFEYMAARRPIVASRLPVLQEILTDGANALLADPLDLEEWDRQIRRILADPNLAKSLVETAHRDFLNRYSWDARARRIISIFAQTDPS